MNVIYILYSYTSKRQKVIFFIILIRWFAVQTKNFFLKNSTIQIMYATKECNTTTKKIVTRTRVKWMNEYTKFIIIRVLYYYFFCNSKIETKKNNLQALKTVCYMCIRVRACEIGLWENKIKKLKRASFFFSSKIFF